MRLRPLPRPPVARLLAVLALACLLAPGSGASASARASARSSGGATHEVYAWGRNNAGQLGLVTYADQHKPELVSLLKGKHVYSVTAGGSEAVDGHTLAIVKPGKLFAAGANTYGQLGSGDHTDRDSFVPVAALYHLEVRQAAAGEMHSLALAADGALYAWGSHAHGQLGLEDSRTEFATPQLVKIDTFGSEKVAGVCAGYQHSVAWTSAGAVWAWGDNSFGQLGIDDRKPSKKPVQVAVPAGLKVAHVACGAHHSLLLTDGGELYAWGHNRAAQLGIEVAGTRDALKPMLVTPFTRQKVAQVVAGAAHSLALTSEGQLWAFGDNSAGQLGTGGKQHPRQPPAQVEATVHWVALAAGRAHSLGIAKDGQVHAWGQGLVGQLGLGESSSRGRPAELKPLSGLKMAALGAGSCTSFAVTPSGEVWGWGKNNVGQMGMRATKTPKMAPEVVLRNQEVAAVKQVAAGGYAYMYEGHSAVLSGAGEVVVWGWNAFGQLGIGEVSGGSAIPARNVWLAKQHVRQLAAGQFATAAVTDAGEVFTWGLNEAGQLGKGDFSSSAVEVPQRIHIDAHIVEVSVGYAHMLALSADGRVYAWGRNFYGQLGVGDHKDKPSPQLISYLQEEQAVAVVAGQYHSLAVTARGDIFGWGYNREYELGVGDNMDRVLPQAIPILQGKKVKSAAACGYHSMAVTEDGSLYSWGLNNYGQLGLGGRKSEGLAKVPGLVTIPGGGAAGSRSGAAKVKSAACGTWHSAAVTDSGALFTWGRCTMGQLGLGGKCGKTGRVDAPEHVRELSMMEVESVACGACHTLAVVTSEQD
eukprot:jgi/Tetstr1/454581/TSEL_041476.t1